MTPERAEYLKGISKEEKVLRHLIKFYKYRLSYNKQQLNNTKSLTFNSTRKCLSYVLTVRDVYENKLILKTLKASLNRLKGMDRVVRVKRHCWIDGVNCLVANCKCGHSIFYYSNYCSNCGRRILWEE